MAICLRNWRKIKITPWAFDRTYTHIRTARDGRVFSDSGGRGPDDAVVKIDASINRVLKIGIFAQLIARKGELQLSDEMNCHDFAEMIDDVVSTGASRIAKLRGYLEDLAGDSDPVSRLDDDAVSFLGWMATELYKEKASEIDNPFDDYQKLTYPIVDMLERYCPSH